MKLLGEGFGWNEMSVGDTYRTFNRTVTETDLVNFVSNSGMAGAVFLNFDTPTRDNDALPRSVVPAALVYCLAEGLILNVTALGTGIALLKVDIDIRASVSVNDTIHVECEIKEIRETSKGRGLVSSQNCIVNQKSETVLIYNSLRLMSRTPDHAAA